MANPHPTKQGRGPAEYRRPSYLYDHPTAGRIFAAVFVQPLTAECRTVEIVRYVGADSWRARVKETRTVINRLGQQIEYAGDRAACNDITDFLTRQGMRMIQQWEAIYPEWSTAAAVAPAARAPQLRGGVQ